MMVSRRFQPEKNEDLRPGPRLLIRRRNPVISRVAARPGAFFGNPKIRAAQAATSSVGLTSVLL